MLRGRDGVREALRRSRPERNAESAEQQRLGEPEPAPSAGAHAWALERDGDRGRAEEPQGERKRGEYVTKQWLKIFKTRWKLRTHSSETFKEFRAQKNKQTNKKKHAP